MPTSKTGPGLTPSLEPDVNQFPYPVRVDARKGVFLEDPTLDGFWELELGAWDMAAGVLIVEEAGGQVSKLNNEPFNLMEREVVASNGLIHQPLLEQLNREGDSP